VLLFISKIAETTSAAINCGSFPFCKMLRPIQMKTNNKIIKFVMKDNWNTLIEKLFP
jgi:hypothetical protein